MLDNTAALPLVAPVKLTGDQADKARIAELEARLAALQALNGTSGETRIVVTMSKAFKNKKGETVASKPELMVVTGGNEFFALKHSASKWKRYQEAVTKPDFDEKLAELEALEKNPAAQARLLTLMGQ